MRIDQNLYSLTNFNFHLQNIYKELTLLKEFMTKNKVHAHSAFDIGCGDGFVTKEIAYLLGAREIHGLDANINLLHKASAKGIVIKHADIDLYKPDKKKYDCVIIYGTVHHVKDTRKLLIKAKEISKKYILIVDSTVRNNFIHKVLGSKYFPLDATPFNIRTKEEIIQTLKEINCKIIDERTNLYANYWHDRSFILASV